MLRILTSFHGFISIVDQDVHRMPLYLRLEVLPVDSVNMTQTWINADEHVASYNLCNTQHQQQQLLPQLHHNV